MGFKESKTYYTTQFIEWGKFELVFTQSSHCVCVCVSVGDISHSLSMEVIGQLWVSVLAVHLD